MDDKNKESIVLTNKGCINVTQLDEIEAMLKILCAREGVHGIDIIHKASEISKLRE